MPNPIQIEQSFSEIGTLDGISNVTNIGTRVIAVSDNGIIYGDGKKYLQDLFEFL
jgi:hypothetical protein